MKKEKEDKELLKALTNFKKQYPSSTSADMQTFVIAWKACIESMKKKDSLGW